MSETLLEVNDLQKQFVVGKNFLRAIALCVKR